MAITAPGWPPPVASSQPTLRVFITATATALFDDRFYLFADYSGIPPSPSAVFDRSPVVPPGGITTPADFGSRDRPGPTYGGWDPRDAPVRQLEFTNRNPAPSGAGTGPALTTVPDKMAVHAGHIAVRNKGGTPLEISFDGVNVHGTVAANERVTYANRHEAGIAVRGAGLVFEIEAW